MEFYLLNDVLSVVGILDRITYSRVTRRFFAPGEISVTAIGNRTVPSSARYIFDPCEGVCAVIEKTESFPDGSFKISGRTAECLFERQVLKRSGYFNGSVENAVRTVLTAFAVSNGAFPNLVIGDTSGLPESAQILFEWKDLSSWLYGTLGRYGGTYRLDLGERDSFFTFNVAFGSDRSSLGDGKSTVVIREEDGSLENVSFSVDERDYANVICVVGNDGRYVTVPDAAPSGLDRREAIILARDLYPASFETDEAYLSALKIRGESRLASFSERIIFTGRASGKGTWRFGKDYFLGDVCDVETKSGLTLALRVTSVTDVTERGVKRRSLGFGGDISSSAVT